MTVALWVNRTYSTAGGRVLFEASADYRSQPPVSPSSPTTIPVTAFKLPCMATQVTPPTATASLRPEPGTTWPWFLTRARPRETRSSFIWMAYYKPPARVFSLRPTPTPLVVFFLLALTGLFVLRLRCKEPPLSSSLRGHRQQQKRRCGGSGRQLELEG